ncbi:hypothetical protein [Micromonospora sediminicola]|uniref:hypothetical protein n=1 Tax=Micromonospora sediminicola TaxID=946078 RepID=UPI0033BAF369
MPRSVDAVDRHAPVSSRSQRLWLLSIVAAAACCFGVLRLTGPAETSAQRYLSQVDVRGYERVHDYLDPGSAPADERAAVAIFVGPPDHDILARVSGPGLVLSAAPSNPGPTDVAAVGRGQWHGCFVHVDRWTTSDPPLSYYPLNAEQVTAFRSGRLSVLDIAVGCGSG